MAVKQDGGDKIVGKKRRSASGFLGLDRCEVWWERVFGPDSSRNSKGLACCPSC